MNSLPIRDQTWLVPQISIHINSRNVWTFVFVRLFFAFLESRKRDHDEKNTLGKNINTSVTSTPPWRYKKGGYFHGHFKDGKRNGEARKITAITQWRDKMTPAADIQMSFFGIFFRVKGMERGSYWCSKFQKNLPASRPRALGTESTTQPRNRAVQGTLLYANGDIYSGT